MIGVGALLAHGPRQLLAIVRANVATRKLGPFDLVNVDEDLIVGVLRDVGKLVGDLCAHVSGKTGCRHRQKS